MFCPYDISTMWIKQMPFLLFFRQERRKRGVRYYCEVTWLAGVRTEGSGSLVECLFLQLILLSSYSLVTHLYCSMPRCLLLLSCVHMSVLLGCACGICVLVVLCVPSGLCNSRRNTPRGFCDPLFPGPQV